LVTVGSTALYAARAPLLCGLATLLIVDEPQAHLEAVVLFGGDRRHDWTAAWYGQGEGRHVLLIASYPDRPVALGLEPRYEEVDRKALVKCGVPDAALQILPGEAHDDWERVRALAIWLSEHPDAHTGVVSDRFAARRVRTICDRLLGPNAKRVHVLALADRRFDESDWWRQKDGQLRFFTEAVRLGYTVLAGERSAPWREGNADEYTVPVQ
jgi:hypothetical protein